MNTDFKEGKRILVVDNHDSFVFNIVQYLQELGAFTEVAQNDEIEPEFCKNFDGVVISPGPGNPQDAGISIGAIKYCDKENIPVLGITGTGGAGTHARRTSVRRQGAQHRGPHVAGQSGVPASFPGQA